MFTSLPAAPATLASSATVTRVLIAGAYLTMACGLFAVWRVRQSAAFLPQALGSVVARGGKPAERMPAMYFIFQAGDCANALAVTKLWNEIFRERGFAMIGILVDPPSDLSVRAATIKVAGIEFPMVDGGRLGIEVINRLGFQQTPVAVLIDSDGQVRLRLGILLRSRGIDPPASPRPIPIIRT